MKKFKFEFDCVDNKDQSLVASFPVGVVTIEKDTLEDACRWFVEHLYPKFDRFAGENVPWRLSLISTTCDEQNVSIKALAMIDKIEAES